MAEAKLQVLVSAKDEASKILGGVNQSITNMSKNFKIAGGIMMGAGAGIFAMLGMTLKAAAEEEAGIMRLSVAMKNVGLDYDSVEDSLEDWIDTMQQKTAIADSEQRDALASLVRMTGDLTEAQDYLTLAMDVAIGTGKDLATANQLVMYAMGGNWGMVERYIPALKAVENEEEKWMELRRLFAGQAEAYGATMEGQMKTMQHNLGDIKEAIGAVVSEALAPIIAKIGDFIRWLKELDPTMLKTITMGALFTGGLLTLGGAMMLIIGFLPALTTGLATLGIRMTGTAAAAGTAAIASGGLHMSLTSLLGVIGGLIGGLALLATGFYMLYEHKRTSQQKAMVFAEEYNRMLRDESNIFAKLLDQKVMEIEMRMASGKATKEEIEFLKERVPLLKAQIEEHKLLTEEIEGYKIAIAMAREEVEGITYETILYSEAEIEAAEAAGKLVKRIADVSTELQIQQTELEVTEEAILAAAKAYDDMSKAATTVATSTPTRPTGEPESPEEQREAIYAKVRAAGQSVISRGGDLSEVIAAMMDWRGVGLPAGVAPPSGAETWTGLRTIGATEKQIINWQNLLQQVGIKIAQFTVPIYLDSELIAEKVIQLTSDGAEVQGF